MIIKGTCLILVKFLSQIVIISSNSPLSGSLNSTSLKTSPTLSSEKSLSSNSMTTIKNTPSVSNPFPEKSSISISPSTIRKIPGVQINWYNQRKGNYLYADKTIYLERLLENKHGRFLFYLTRPRRFGKSLFLQMAQHFFKGDGDLFKGLHIGNKGNFHFYEKSFVGDLPKEVTNKTWIRCPIIYLDFSGFKNFNTVSDFIKSYMLELKYIANLYDVEFNFEHDPDIHNLIRDLEFKFKLSVVVLIDEYDAPFQFASMILKNNTLANEILTFFSGMFRNIKACQNELRLVLVLGVSRLAFTSLQTGANNFVELTYEEEFAEAFGFTNEDIESFRPEIARQFNHENEKQTDEFISKLKENYDGYNFTFQNKDRKSKNVLNPVSTMKSIASKKIDWYWSKTCSIDEVIRRLYFSREPLQTFEHFKLLRKDIEKIYNFMGNSVPLEIFMLQYGYLTIQSYNEETEEVTLNFPNKEIITALETSIREYKVEEDKFLSQEDSWFHELNWHMNTGYVGGAMNTLTNMIQKSIFKTLKRGISEFNTTLRLIEKLNGAGIYCRKSVKFMKEKLPEKEAGDVDVMTTNLQNNFIISIKYDYTANMAIQQLITYLKENPNTFLKAINNPEEAWFVGINFESTRGALDQWVALHFKNGILSYDECKASVQEFCESIRKQNANKT